MKSSRLKDRIRALELRLERACLPRERIDVLTELGFALRMLYEQRAPEVFQKAYQLSQAGEFADRPYQPGLAASLVGLAYLDLDAGRLEFSAQRCFEALTLLEETPSAITVRAWIILAWVQLFLGDYPASLQWGLKGLDLARLLGIGERQAFALDIIGAAYSLMGDARQALENHAMAVQLIRCEGNQAAEAFILNNQAMALLQAGEVGTALSVALRSLELARQECLIRIEANIADTVGQILVEMGELALAQQYLQPALGHALNEDHQIEQTYLFKSLGRVCMGENDLERAHACFENALKAATQIGARGESAQCYRLLSELHERRGDYHQALENYKHYHELVEITTGEAANRRMAVLKITYQVETAQRQAELHRLRNVELQSEIEERKRVQAILEKLATLDPLTNLYNRRHFLAQAEREFERSVRCQRPICVLMLDLDHFKSINDTYGHAVGDQVLVMASGILQTCLRQADFAGRFGGEEFAVVLPEIGLECGLKVGERIRQKIAAQVIQTDDGPLGITVSIGVFSWAGEGERASINMSFLLNQADQALYAAKRAGRNCTRTLVKPWIECTN